MKISLSLIWLVIVCTQLTNGYYPEQMECPPRQLNPEIFHQDYWFPPNAPYRALLTLPWRMFTIKKSIIPGAGLGVFTRTFIPKYTWLGEYEGEMLNLRQAKKVKNFSYAWRVYTDDDMTHFVDARRVMISNWLRFVNCPTHSSQENVVEHTCFGRIYYRTNVDIAPGQELFIYYGDLYAERSLNIDLDDYYNKTMKNS